MTTSITNATKKALMTVAAASAFVLWPTLASAHTIDLCWRNEANGDITFFAGAYEPNALASGALVIDGAQYAFTGQQYELPSDVSGCQLAPCTSFFQVATWLTVRVSAMPIATREISTTCTSAVECGWPFCYPIVEEVGMEEDPTDPGDPGDPCEDSSSDSDSDLNSVSDEDSDSVSDSQSDEPGENDPNDADSDSISVDGGPSISIGECSEPSSDPVPEPSPIPVGVPDGEEFVVAFDGGDDALAGCQAGGTGPAPWIALVVVFGLAWLRRRD